MQSTLFIGYESARSRTIIGIFAAVLMALTGLVAIPASATSGDLDILVGDDPVDFTPHALDGKVWDVAEVGNRIVVAGSFTQIQNAGGGAVINQPYLFAFDPDTGAIDMGFRPTLNGEVQSVAGAPDGNSLYAGGFFTNVNGTTRNRLARINMDGSLNGAFNASTNSRIYEVVLRGNRLYVGGNFTSIKGVARTNLAAVDPTTGAVDAAVNHVFADPWGGTGPGGALSIRALDVTPDGTRLIAVGNFGTVDGADRDSIVQFDVGQSPSTLYNWRTTRYRQNACFSAFDTYMRDVDVAPDGSYFAVATTGGGVRGSLCDTIARWELDASGDNLVETWENSSGGDTFWSAGVTSEIVYVGGHQRWVNNPFGRDFAGPGAVSREGIAAFDPRNGLPVSWNPGRTRGVGLFDFLANDDGVYAVSDTDRWGAYEYHGRIAQFPAADGAPLPPDAPGPIPGTMLQAQSRTGAANPAYLHRVNTGGPALGSIDSGPDWAADNGTDSPYRNSGSNSAGWTAVPRTDGSVPDSAPSALFSSERWDPGSAPEMMWDFPVTAGREVQVRLYLANRCTCTQFPGIRQFDVFIDGNQVLDNRDLAADPGHDVGTMESFTITSDGIVDIDFSHVIENPLVNGIEIVDPALLDDPFDASTSMQLTQFDGDSATSPSDVSGGYDWSQARGTFMLSGELFVLWADGTFTRQSFDGATFGTPEQIDLNGLGSNEFPISSLTGVTYDPITARIYYTVQGSSSLFYRYFQPESGVVGAVTFTASGNVAGVNWSDVRGLHLDVASNRLFHGGTDGNLRSISFTSGTPQGGTSTLISGPGVGDGLTWSGRLTTYSGDDVVLPNQAPTAAINTDCDGLDCVFTSTGSGDSDGTIVSYEWDFGDGDGDTGPSTSHTFAEGTYQVTLTVTDDDGAIGTATDQLDFAGPPEAVIDVSCVGLTCTFDGSGSNDAGEPVESYAWDFGDGQSSTEGVVEHTYDAADTYAVSLTVMDDEGESATATQDVAVSELDESISFVASESTNGYQTNFNMLVPPEVQPGDLLLLTVSASRPNIGDEEPTGVTDWTREDTMVANNLTSTVWSQVADGSEAGQTLNVSMEGTRTKADIALLAYRGTDPVDPIVVSEVTTEVITTADHTTPEAVIGIQGAWVVSYWADRTSATTAWTPPAGQTLRHEGYTTAGGRVTSLVTDSGGPVVSGTIGGLTATADSANYQATMWTFGLAPSTFEPGDPLPPVAAASADCQGLSCAFDGSDSADNDGTVVSWDWDFGDGNTGTGVTTDHDYTAEDTYDVTLTVTDDDDLTDSTTFQVVAGGAPDAVIDVSCAGLSCTFDGTNSMDAGDPVVSYDWDLGDGTTATTGTVEHDYGAPGRYTVSLTVTDDENESTTVTREVNVVELADEVSFVATDSTQGYRTSFDVTIPTGVQPDDLLLLTVAASRPNIGDEAPTGVTGWNREDTVVVKNLTSTVWSKVASGAEAGQTVTVSMEGSRTKADVAVLAYRGVDPTAPIVVSEVAEETQNRADHTTPTADLAVDGAWVVSYWADRTSSTTAWTPPAGVTVRHEGYTDAGGRVTAIAADSGGPVSAGPIGGLTATADSANSQAAMWTLALAPAN